MPDHPSPQLEALRTAAEAHLDNGRLDEARACLESICAANDADVAAWHMLGLVHSAAGDLEHALCCARKTTELEPAAVSGYRNRGSFQLQLGQLEAAEASFRKALALSAGAATDHANLGATLSARQCHAEAIDCYRQALAQEPGNPEIHFNLGAACQALSRWAEAAQSYEQACRLKPTERRYLASLAVVLRACNQMDHVLLVWSRLLELYPDDLEAMRNIAGVHYDRGDFAAAAKIYERALQVAPDKFKPRFDLGLTYLELGHAEKALDCFGWILERKPAHPFARYNHALALERLGRLEDALAEYRQVRPGEHGLDIAGAQACILERLGEFDQAHALVETALRAGAPGLRTVDAGSKLCKRYDDCDRVTALIEARLAQPDLPAADARLLHFRAGELYDRQQQYDAAFRHFEAGNRLKGCRYNADEDRDYVDRLIAVLQPDLYERLPAASVDRTAVTPIFIIGMPRSGTTLVEQILAAHPLVHAGDELPFIAEIVTRERDCAGELLGYPEHLACLDEDDCNAMRREYLGRLSALAPGARYVTDKMPHNFPFVALIHRLFPESPIIHCQRDPLDVCLSCYFQDFASYHNYAYDLEHLGLHHVQYQRAMTHARNELGVPMFESCYEDLVDDFDPRCRAIVEYCGLPWDARCLEFHASGRRSNTASYDQVRQPIYTRSVRRWKNYAQHLGPLLRILGPPQGGVPE